MPRRTGVLLLLAVAAGAGQEPGAGGTAAAADDAADRAFLEVATARDTGYVGERIRIRLRIGTDAEWFRSHALPLFRQHVDLPVEVQATWLAGLPGLRPLGTPASSGGDPAAPKAGFALNGGPGEATPVGEQVRNGRRFRVLECVREFVAANPGGVVVPEAALRFAHATGFDEDLLQGRVPRDRHDVTVRSPPIRLRIRPLPQEGRPPGFGGAVGRFEIRAELDDAAAAPGGPIVLRVHLTGDGDLDAVDPPRLPGGQGFHVRGMTETREPGRRTFACEIVPLDATARTVPPVPFTWFDPEPGGGYRTTQTAPIPLDAPAGAGPVAAPAPAGDPVPGAETRRGAEDGSPWMRFLAWTSAGALACLLGSWWALRRRAASRAAPDPAVERARAAAETFRAATAAAGADVAAAFADYLAARLGCAPAALVSPDLPRRLQSGGLDAALAARAASLLDRLIEARYGGAAPAGAAAEAADIVLGIEAALAPRPAPA